MGWGSNPPPLVFMNERICLDVDGIICDIAEGIGRGLSKIGKAEYDYSTWLTSYSDDPLMKDIMDNYLFWINLKPIKESWHKINAWWLSGYEVHFITSRYSEHSQRALPTWLDNWNVAYTSLHFVNMGSKWERVEKLNGLFMIDDNPHEVEILNEKKLNALLMKTWYNESYWNSLPSVNSLLEVSPSNYERP
jgi:hypothetical protein